MEGGCSCGHARYRLETAPIAVHCCHCVACQRETGAAFAINAFIEAVNLTVLPPTPPTMPASREAPDTFPPAGPALPHAAGQNDSQELIRVPIPQESGEAQTITRCPRCFTAVWTEYAFGPAVKVVRAGTLDRAWLLQPDLHLYVRSKMDFYKIDDGKPQFEEYYDRTKVWRPESLERWDRLKPEIKRYRDSLKTE